MPENDKNLADESSELNHNSFEQTSKSKRSFLVLYNDDYNTFVWAIKSIMEICDYTSYQAEQLCLIIHHKGEATIKKGDLNTLLPMKEAFINRGISASIKSDKV